MQVKVFQVNKENFREFGFMDYEFFKEHGCEKMRRDMFRLVFDGDLKADTLEGVFEECNLSCPEGYKGHSMSVSDLVETKDGLFFCDSFGFKKVGWTE